MVSFNQLLRIAAIVPKLEVCPARCLTSVIFAAPRKLKQEDYSKLEASIRYIVSSRQPEYRVRPSIKTKTMDLGGRGDLVGEASAAQI